MTTSEEYEIMIGNHAAAHACKGAKVQVVAAYPRLSFNLAMTELLVLQVKRKPQMAAFTWLAEVGRSCIHGFVSPNWNDMLNSSPFTE